MTHPKSISTRPMPLRPSPFGDLLPSPLEQDFGTVPEDRITVRGLEIRLGDRPVAFDLRDLYRQVHGAGPATRFDVYRAYDIWLIRHHVGVILRSGSTSVRRLGYVVEFDDPEAAYVIELFPQSRFIRRFATTIETNFDLTADGCGSVATEPPQTDAFGLGGGIRGKFSTRAELLGGLSFSVLTPQVQAVGNGASRCEWCFQATDEPLLGDQTMLQTVLVYKGARRLKLRTRAYAQVRAHWLSFPATFETDWLEVDCPLVSEGGATP